MFGLKIMTKKTFARRLNTASQMSRLNQSEQDNKFIQSLLDSNFRLQKEINRLKGVKK